MNMFKAAGIPAALVAGLLATTAVSADSLLGVVGSDGSDAIVTIGSGEAGSSGVVNVGVGGGNGNIVDANVLPSGGPNVVDATISTGTGEGALAVDGTVGGAVEGSVSIGGSSDNGNGLISVHVGGPGGSEGATSGNTGGSTGADGAGNGSGGSSGSGSAGSMGAVTGPVLGIEPDGVGAGTAAHASCGGLDAGRAVALYESSSSGDWNQASSIEIVPVELCGNARQAVASYLQNSAGIGNMRSAVASDPLINAALSRTSYDADRVLAVTRTDNRLTVYVF